MTCPACRRQYLVVFGLFLLFMLAVVGKVGAQATPLERHAGEMVCGRQMLADLSTGEIRCVPLAPRCDLAELLAASREWADVLILYDRMSDLIGRRLVPETKVALAPLYRWFRAVEACR